MKLYLVRHGEAIDEETAGSDRDRWLNQRGRQQVRALGQLMRENGCAPDAMVSSPLPRAAQTGELLASALDFFGELTILRGLEPSAQPAVVARALAGLGSSVVVVGHEPNISALGAVMLGLPSFQPFRTAQCCLIENGVPVWLARGDLNQVVAMFRPE